MRTTVEAVGQLVAADGQAVVVIYCVLYRVIVK